MRAFAVGGAQDTTQSPLKSDGLGVSNGGALVGMFMYN